MKKYMIVFLMAFVLIGSVIAAGNTPDSQKVTTTSVTAKQLSNQELKVLEAGKPLDIKDTIKIEKGNLTGLYNAQIRVRNEVALQKIQLNIDRIKEKLKISDSAEVEIEELDTGAFKAKINKNAKFLGLFNAKITDKAILDSEGNVIYQKKSFWRFLYKVEE